MYKRVQMACVGMKGEMSNLEMKEAKTKEQRYQIKT